MAVTITLEAFTRRVSGAAETDGAEILEAAKAIVERYAPGAPSPVQNEAVVRLGGYLAQSDYAGLCLRRSGPSLRPTR